MKTITATVTEQNLIITPSVISVAESVGLYALKISYDEEWDEVDTKIITFTAPTGVSIAIQDTEAEEGVIIPWEVLQNPGKVTVGAVGYIGTTAKVTTTGLYKRNTFVVQPEAFGLQDAMTPTPDIYQTLIQTIDEINQSITNLQTNINTVADDVAEVAEDVGDLGSLETENKDNLVDAINEVLSGAGGGAVSSVNGKTGVVVLKTSDIENDSGYQTQIQTIEAINDAIDAFDESVDNKIATEATAREQADTRLDTAISGLTDALATETTARTTSDTNLQSQIDAISASSDVTDIVGTYADLQNYDTSTLGNNDIIKVLQDESRNDETTYYRWSTTTQTFTLIGEEGPYYTKSAADQKFQNKLTAGSNISIDANNEISATDTTYSDFTGTDGQTAGTAGLVPAPATTDDGKFLSADGTWGTPTDTTYTAGAGLVLTGTVFSGDVNYRALNGASAPTTATEAKYVGQLYYDTTAGNMYYCSAITPQGTTPETYTYTWAQLGGGGGGFDPYDESRNYSDIVIPDGPNYNVNNTSVYISPRIGSGTLTPQNRTVNILGRANNAYLQTVQIGYGAEATGTNAIAIGESNAAARAIAIGSDFTGAVGADSIAIGQRATANGNANYGISMGNRSSVTNVASLALGYYASASGGNSVALGREAKATREGEVNIGAGTTTNGYNSTSYRVLGGVHPAVDDHDAVTLGQLNARILAGGTAAPTTSTVGEVGTLYAYVESGTGHLAICTDDTGGTYTWQTLI